MGMRDAHWKWRVGYLSMRDVCVRWSEALGHMHAERWTGKRGGMKHDLRKCITITSAINLKTCRLHLSLTLVLCLYQTPGQDFARDQSRDQQ